MTRFAVAIGSPDTFLETFTCARISEILPGPSRAVTDQPESGERCCCKAGYKPHGLLAQCESWRLDMRRKSRDKRSTNLFFAVVA